MSKPISKRQGKTTYEGNTYNYVPEFRRHLKSRYHRAIRDYNKQLVTDQLNEYLNCEDEYDPLYDELAMWDNRRNMDECMDLFADIGDGDIIVQIGNSWITTCESCRLMSVEYRKRKLCSFCCK